MASMSHSSGRTCLLRIVCRSWGASRRSKVTSASGIALDEGGAGGASRRSEATSASGIALDEGAPVVIGLEL